MPILTAEVSQFPEDLLSEPVGTLADTGERRWWVAHTKPRQEKSLARQLLGNEVPFYLPLIPKDNIIRGHRVRSFVPLFGGYLFLHVDERQRERSFAANRVTYMLPVPDEHRLFRDLQQVARLIACEAPLTLESRLAPGQLVRIKSGPMQGIEGLLLSRRGRAKLIVAVDFLQQGASVELDDFQIEPL